MGKNDYAIVVGVRYPGLFPLRATLDDATRMLEWLTSPEGGDVPHDHCTAVLSEPNLPPNSVTPTRREIQSALEGILAGRERPGQRFYFYFAGHGFSPKFNEVGMLMADATIDALNRNIGLESLLELFTDRLLFREIVCILDCCRESSPRNRNVQIPPLDFTLPQSHTLPDVDLFVVLATPYGRKAFEPATTGASNGQLEERRGLLTAALLACLDEDRLAERDSTSDSLEDSLKLRMKALAATVRDKQVRKQAPEFMYQPRKGPLVLAKRPRKSRRAAPAVMDAAAAPAPTAAGGAVLVRIVAPSKLSGDLVVYDDAMKPIARRSAAAATAKKPAWRVPLMPNRRYAVGRDATDAVPQIIEDVLRLPTAQDNGHVYRFPASG